MGRRFSYTITSEMLARGLRPSKRVPRNSGYLVTCTGVVGREGSLQVPDELTRLATTAITDGFPFPQVFIFREIIIVCGLSKIYEWASSALSLKLTTTAGGPWVAIASGAYAYLSNGIVSVVRDPGTKAYSETSSLPTATAMCNFNGQIIVGAPDVAGNGADMNLANDPIELTASQEGSWS